MLSIAVNVHNRRVTVVGGGNVGARKAAIVLEAGGIVRIIDPEPTETVQKRPGWDVLAEAYRPEHLDGSFLVIVALPIPRNREVVAEARARGILVCDAAEPETGDFIFPALHKTGDLTITVSTAGASPTLAGQIRDRLAAEYDATYAEWLSILSELRSVVLEQIDDRTVRKALFAEFAGWHWLDRLRQDGPALTRQAMVARITEST